MSNENLLAELRRIFPNAAEIGSNLNPEDADYSAQIAEVEAAARALRDPVGVRAHGPVPSLDLWTHKPPYSGHVELKITDFGGGYTEATATVRPADFRPPRPGKKRTKHSGDASREVMSEDDRARCAQRAKLQVRHRIKRLGADRILTLTSRGYLKTPDDVWAAFGCFSSLMRKELASRWAYVAVPELHKSGDHWHLHLAIAGRLSAQQCRRIWHVALRRTFPAAVYDHAPGNPDIAYRQKTVAPRLNSIARYMSKYITKAVDAGFLHRKRYESSRNIPDPKIHRFFLDLSAVTDLRIIRKIQEVSGGVLSRSPSWEVYGGFDCLVAETGPPDWT